MTDPPPRHALLSDEKVTLDLDRHLRCGFPEVVYGEGKTDDAIVAVFETLFARGEPSLATRVDAEKADRIARRLPRARYNPVARTLRLDAAGSNAPIRGAAAVISAGSS
ncbi:MAG: hypothetical protein KDA37_02660, partial [Planctomycetales bacterium]|nr:hypothetical protein [Planctomycetales bacterium]